MCWGFFFYIYLTTAKYVYLSIYIYIYKYIYLSIYVEKYIFTNLVFTRFLLIILFSSNSTCEQLLSKMRNSNVIFQKPHIYLSLFSYNALLKYKIHAESFINHECTDRISEQSEHTYVASAQTRTWKVTRWSLKGPLPPPVTATWQEPQC